MNELQFGFRGQPWFQLNQLVAMPIGPESFFDGNQPLFAFGMEGARLVLKEEVVVDDTRFHL
jgi:hypothetical protein